MGVAGVRGVGVEVLRSEGLGIGVGDGGRSRGVEVMGSGCWGQLGG